MTAPGVIVQVQTTPPPRSAPTDTGVGFAAGLCDQGVTNAPILVQSLDDFNTLCGGRVTYSILYDAIDAFFREGGNACYIARVVGPSAVNASHTFNDGSSVASLKISALGPGSYGNSLKAAIIAGAVSGYRVQIADVNNNILETSYDLTTQVDAVTWAQQYSAYVSATVMSSANAPSTAASVALASGTDDRGSIVDAQWLTALNLFSTDLGPGQVFAPGRTSATGQAQLADHAQARNRTAILDLPDDSVAANLVTDAASGGASTGHGQYAMAFAPWIRIPGVSGGTTRVIPPSGAVAGLMARNDVLNGPGDPAAGQDGQFRSVIGVSQAAWDSTTRDTLNTGGVNVIRNLFNGFRVYGYRTLANPVTNPQWVQGNVLRYLMGLVGRCKAVGEVFMFQPIDGAGHLFSDYAGALGAELQTDWAAGVIYGQTPADAYNVDCGPSVNTPTSIALGQVKAVVAVRPSPFAELVYVTIVNTPITQAVS